MNPSNSNSNQSSLANETGDPTIRILLVDDQRMIREGLKALLITQPDLEVVGTADDGQAAIEQVETLKPDVVLMDMEMPGMDGVSATKVICSKFPGTKILVLSTFDNNEYITQSIAAGAMGYILKGTPAKDLTEAVRSIHRGYAQIGPGAFQKILPLVSKAESEKIKARSPITTQEATSGAASSVGLATKEKTAIATDTSIGKPASALALRTKSSLATQTFDQSIVLRQSPKWSRAIIWSIVAFTTFGLIWSMVAKIEQVVPAQGQLKPKGKVQEVQAPVNGVVKQVYVHDGDRVKKDQLLVSFDTTASAAELKSQKAILEALKGENKFYRALMENPLSTLKVEEAIAKYDLPREIASLARNRNSLITENDLFRTQLGIGDKKKTLDPEQLRRLQASQSELSSRSAAARLDVEQQEKQLSQTQVQLANAKVQLAQARQTLAEIQSRNQKAVLNAEESLKLEKDVFGYVDPLVREGVVSRIQVDRQRQEVNDRVSKLVEQRSSGTIEYNKQQQEIQTHLSEIRRFEEEEKRLRFAVAQAKEKLNNTNFSTEKEVLDKIGENQKRIAEIDSQIVKAVVDNDKQISELDSKISASEQTLKYQELRSPVNGTVFDLKAFPGYVQQVTRQDPVLKVVPNDRFIAEVYITNQDIGFVRPDMKAEVMLDTFPFSEFGKLTGKVLEIGSDALPPDQSKNYNFYRFPAKVELDQQYLPYRDKQIPLQSGMSLKANIKVRENRTVMSLFTEHFAKDVDRFKEMR